MLRAGLFAGDGVHFILTIPLLAGKYFLLPFSPARYIHHAAFCFGLTSQVPPSEAYWASAYANVQLLSWALLVWSRHRVTPGEVEGTSR